MDDLYEVDFVKFDVLDLRNDFALEEVYWFLAGRLPPADSNIGKTDPGLMEARQWSSILYEWEQDGRLKVFRQDGKDARGHPFKPRVRREDVVIAFEADENGLRPPFFFPKSRIPKIEEIPDESVKPSHKKLIGVLVRLLLADDAEFAGVKSKFENSAKLKEYIVDNFSGVRGLSVRSLDTMLAEGTRSLKE